jgi:hypothetical protein
MPLPSLLVVPAQRTVLLVLLVLAAALLLTGCGAGTNGGSVGTEPNDVPTPTNSPAATAPVPTSS